MAIGEKIQELRKSKGLSQEQLSLEIGVSRQAVSKWESNQSFPDIDKIVMLSEFFGVSTDYILLDSVDTQEPKTAKDEAAEEKTPIEKKSKKIKVILLSVLTVVLISVAVISVILATSELIPPIGNSAVNNSGNGDYSNESDGYGFYGYTHYRIEVGGYNAAVSFSLNDDSGEIGMNKSTIKTADGKVYIVTDIGPTSNKRNTSDYVECTSDVTVKEIYIDGRLVWKDGLEITPIVYDIFNAKREDIDEAFSGYSEIAYLTGLDEDISAELTHTDIYASANRVVYEKQLGLDNVYLERIKEECTMSAYMLLGVIGKLEAVDFKFLSENGDEISFSVTEDDADEFYGGDIKELGKDIVVLQNFVNDRVGGLLRCFFEDYYYDNFLRGNPYYQDIAVCPIVETPSIKTVKVRCFFGDNYLVATQSAFLIQERLGWQSSSYGNMHIDEKTFGVSILNNSASQSHDMAYIDFIAVDLDGNEYAFENSRFYTRDIFAGKYTIEFPENYDVSDKIPSVEVSIIEKNNTYYIYDGNSKTYTPAVPLSK